jgi:hypothetical protein
MKTKKKNLALFGLGLVLSLSCTSSVVAADTAGFTSGSTKVLTTMPLKNGLTATRVHHRQLTARGNVRSTTLHV